MIAGRCGYVGAWPSWWPSDPMRPAMPPITSKADPDSLYFRAQQGFREGKQRASISEAGSDDLLALLLLLLGVL